MSTTFTCPDGHTFTRRIDTRDYEDGKQYEIHCPYCGEKKNCTCGVDTDKIVDEGDDDEVLVACPECGTAQYRDPEEAEEIAETHNEKRHDGEEVAGVGRATLKVEETDLTDEQMIRLARNLRRKKENA